MSATDRWLEYEPRLPHEPDGQVRFRVHGGPNRPTTRFEACVQRRSASYDWFIGLRFVVEGQPRAWMLVDDWWEWTCVAVAPSAASAGIIDHIRSADVEASPDWVEWFRRKLAGPQSPVWPGLWQLAPLPQRPARLQAPWYASPPPRQKVPVPWPTFFDTDAFDEVIPTRAPSSTDSGRVKWWRKVARSGALPPVLLMYSAPLLGWVVLDGHDRLLAAALEGTEPRFVGLSPLRRHDLPPDPQTRATIEAALAAQLDRKPGDAATLQAVNRTLVALYEDHYVSVCQRTWPLAGGVSAWRAEVARLPAIGAERELRDTMCAS